MKILATLLLVLLTAAKAHAQIEVAAENIRLETGPCIITSQAGPPVRLVFTGSCDGITNASGNFELNPAGDLIINPGGKDILPTLGYDINLGSLQKKLLAIHAAELWIETIVAQNTIGTIGGRVLVAPTNLLTADLGSGDTSITVKYNNLANGDRAYMEADGKVEFFAITSAAGGSAGAYTYSVTRNLDGTGANDWFAGDAMLNTGQAGNGFIDLYSVRGVKAGTEVGPSIVFNQRLSSTYNDWAPRGAVGQLDGLYGYSGSTYGAAFGNPSATNVTVDATNGFRIRSGTTNKLVADTSGNLSIVGDLTVGTSGVIRSGATNYSSGVGWIMEYNGGTPRMRIGDPSGNRLTWDGSTATLVGTITATSGTIGGWTLGATSLTSGSSTVGLDSGGSNPAFYAGSATPGSAPFRVTQAGALTATSATITGTVTATSGTIGGWTLGATSLTSGSGATTRGIDSGGSNPAFYAGSATPGSAPFRVTAAGAVTSSSMTITGGTITVGDVTLNSSGIAINEGNGASNKIKWTGGNGQIYHDGVMYIRGDGSVNITINGTTYLTWNGTSLLTNTSSDDIGSSSSVWRKGYFGETIRIDNQAGTGNNYACFSSTGELFRGAGGC